MECSPESLTTAERYKLMIGGIVPRPIAFVSTISPDGRLNLAPFSFFNGIGSNPMTLLFCPVNNNDGTEKDSLRNAKPREEGGTGEFVVNVATEAYIREVAATSEALPYGESEFELAKLHAAPSRVVTPPRVKDSPIALECRTLQVVRTNGREPAAGNVVIGEVVHVFVRDDLVNERYHIDHEKLAAVGRMGGPLYCRSQDVFELPRGRAALETDHG
ncbi:MAG: flavin reductase family protein [Phycisphaerales bacterium]|nr:MAG: flavin reductase family protein [Phycisphaerales bacterium]